MSDIKQALANILDAAERECWSLFNSEVNDEAQKQNIIGQLKGIETMLGFIDDELSVLAMRESV
jgi:hypothetical protein